MYAVLSKDKTIEIVTTSYSKAHNLCYILRHTKWCKIVKLTENKKEATSMTPKIFVIKDDEEIYHYTDTISNAEHYFLRYKKTFPKCYMTVYYEKIKLLGEEIR